MKTKNAPSGPRVARTIGIRPDQDRWLAETLGEDGNLSGFVQSLLDGCRRGDIPMRQYLRGPGNLSALQRAEAYLKAKEAGMLFEEDVGAEVTRWVGDKRDSVRVSKSRIHNGNGSFIADFSIETADGAVICSVVCKSNTRADRLQIALAEAMIGQSKTGKPVITVVPYLTPESHEGAEQFKLLGFRLVTLVELGSALTDVRNMTGAGRKPGK